eukprot:CFRG1186T1
MKQEGGLDADEMLERLDEQHWAALIKSGEYSEEEVKEARKRLAIREEISMCKAMRLMGLEETDKMVLRIAGLQLELEKRHLAIETLLQYHLTAPHQNTRVSLLLAKLMFRDDQKGKAMILCQEVVDRFKENKELDVDVVRTNQQTNNMHTNPSDDHIELDSEEAQEDYMNLKDVADAFYILGWIAIHAGDHTLAYRVWEDGYRCLPNDVRLIKQHLKRQCWDSEILNSETSGDAPISTGKNHIVKTECASLVDSDHQRNTSDEGVQSNLIRDDLSQGNISNYACTDFDAFCVDYKHRREVALNLFDTKTQQGRVVFRSKKPIMPYEERRMVLDACEDFAKERGGWGTVRHCSVPTTDVAVEDIPVLRPWLRSLMSNRLSPMLCECFPCLADGTDLGPNGNRVRIHDAFVVRYDECDKSLSLPTHSDTSSLSFTIALSESSDYVGGGTWFEALGQRVVDAPAGHAVGFAGPLRHAGHPITKGTRTILVLFCYVDGFKYGEYVGFDGKDNQNVEKKVVHDHDNDDMMGKLSVKDDDKSVAMGTEDDIPEDDEYEVGNGYIIYNETYELMTTVDQV